MKNNTQVLNTTSKTGKSDRLMVLANKRIPKAIKAIELVGNLHGYNPTEEQTDKMLQALGEALSQASNRLKNAERKETSFQL